MSEAGRRLCEVARASWFDLSGNANGFMSRGSHIQMIGLFGLIVPLFEMLLFYVMRYKPDKTLNIPNRAHWLAPERREETARYLFQHSVWLACMTLAFFIMINWMIVTANAMKPVHLPIAMVIGPTAAFLVCVAVWAFTILRRFKKISA